MQNIVAAGILIKLYNGERAVAGLMKTAEEEFSHL